MKLELHISRLYEDGTTGAPHTTVDLDAEDDLTPAILEHLSGAAVGDAFDLTILVTAETGA